MAKTKKVNKVYLSVVIPLYKCEPFILELSIRLSSLLLTLVDDYEIIFVNDASPMNDWEIVTRAASREKRIKGINFSRNFGQHNAITAGLEYATGDWVVVMDGDLQDRPEEIKKLYQKTKEGYDIVLAQRFERQDSILKKLSSSIFYSIFGYLTDTKLDKSIANFGIYHKKVVNSMLSMKDHVRYMPTMVGWVGFNKTAIPVVHNVRSSGQSSYSIKRLLNLAINNIIAFSDKPLKLTVRLGFFISFGSLVFGVFSLYRYFTNQITTMGYASIIISIWFLSGIIISILGIIGLYLGKTFDKVKDRPLYIINDKINL